VPDEVVRRGEDPDGKESAAPVENPPREAEEKAERREARDPGRQTQGCLRKAQKAGNGEFRPQEADGRHLRVPEGIRQSREVAVEEMDRDGCFVGRQSEVHHETRRAPREAEGEEDHRPPPQFAPESSLQGQNPTPSERTNEGLSTSGLKR
jgi:hypothetical protein